MRKTLEKIAKVTAGIVLSASLAAGCTTFKIINNGGKIDFNKHVTVEQNSPPEINYNKKTNIIYMDDPDKNIIEWGWDLDEGIFYAIDDCGAKTIINIYE